MNQVAGTGLHSHEVPTTVGVPVLMKDSNYEGVLIERLPTGRYQFTGLGVTLDPLTTFDHVELVQGADIEIVSKICPAFACNLDCPDGLTFIGYNHQPTASHGGTILWKN